MSFFLVAPLFFWLSFPPLPEQIRPPEPQQKQEIKDKLFLMGIGILRINWANVHGNEIRFRYSDMGLPADLSTRERASFMLDGTFGHGKYAINGHLDYDPENRITEPPLDFLVTVGNKKQYLSVGDYRMGVLQDSIFSRYYHPFRGGLIGVRSEKLGAELIAGMARGEAGIEEITADLGAGPYYLADAPIIRGSEIIFQVVRSSVNPEIELKRTPLVRNRDYYIDYDRGSVLFTYPIYPTDEMGNPVSLVASYQFESFSGRFTRDVLGFRAFYSPFPFLKINFNSISDADGQLKLDQAWKQRRSIYSFGLNIDSKPVFFTGEYSFSDEPGQSSKHALFGGGFWRINKRVTAFVNSWNLDSGFPTFANEQLKYGYSLFQVFPGLAQRTLFLSPFQFTRNLGAELYPFSLSRIMEDERETHGYLEWEKGNTRVSTGYGDQKRLLSLLSHRLFYVSALHDGEKTKTWAKIGWSRNQGSDSATVSSRTLDLLLGARQRLWQGKKGGVFLQADFSRQDEDDLAIADSDTVRSQASISAEYLTGREGFFAAYRKERYTHSDLKTTLLDADIYELGVLHRIYKGLFVDSRFRREESDGAQGGIRNQILSLGGGYENPRFRGQIRYEVQMNRSGDFEGRRTLWSVFLFGTPTKNMNISLRYYKQGGQTPSPLSLTERSEEELNFRLLWRPFQSLSLYSQWRYDTNLELLPPLDGIRSNSLASIQGLKWRIVNRLEFLANYKLLRIWGPLENRRMTAAAELGYLIIRHFRLGVGVERIDFRDSTRPENDYRTTVGYFKLMVVY